MQRLNNERGAVSVVVALLMIPLIAFAAIAIDVAALWSERQQLQTGADAAALAIAQDCARGACGTPAATATTLTAANFNGTATSAVLTPALSATTGHVTVRNSTVSKHLFAPVLGFDETQVSAQATVDWGSPTGGRAVLPLAFSWCEFKAQTGGGLPSGSTARVIFFTKSSGTTCTGPSNNIVPGGFGWLEPDAGSCNATSARSGILWSSTGASVPSSCSTTGLAAAQGKTVLLPIFDEAGDSGSNAWYRVYGYAAFKITGYYFGGQYVWNGGPECKGEDRCIKGYFTRFVDLTEAFDYGAGAPSLGAAVISLTQ